MKKKEIKNIAQKIFECEEIIANSSDKAEIQKAQGMILALSHRVNNLDDMLEIDVLVQEMLAQKN